jgi:hypothetical protein
MALVPIFQSIAEVLQSINSGFDDLAPSQLASSCSYRARPNEPIFTRSSS